jgi:hypothetical protein
MDVGNSPHLADPLGVLAPCLSDPMFELSLGFDLGDPHIVDGREVLPIIYPPKAPVQHTSFHSVDGTR